MRSLFVKLLLFFYLGASHLGATHIHLDECTSDDGCEVCVVVKNFHSADILQSDIPAEFVDFGYLEPTTDSHYQLLSINKGYFSTAPPLV